MGLCVLWGPGASGFGCRRGFRGRAGGAYRRARDWRAAGIGLWIARGVGWVGVVGVWGSNMTLGICHFRHYCLCHFSFMPVAVVLPVYRPSPPPPPVLRSGLEVRWA